jgi:PXPV repeat (3 copies)
MKKLMAAVLAVVLLSPAVAFAGSAATNAALGLGAFAVFNQILGGVGIFGGPRPVYAAPAPVYMAPAPVYTPPPVVYMPPPVVYTSPPVVYAPPAVVVAPPVVVRRPVVVRPHHVYPVYGHRPVVYQRW